ncbi:MAG: NAD-dependent epimerase, partial [Kiritimatiellae bacterium]|nr:NAD-dependent epimerase [Kiritimatiellia bacterium]
GSEEVVSLRELADLLCACVPGARYVVKEFPADRKTIDIGDYYADYGLIRKRLGWQPRVRLREGLARTVEYYRAHLQHYL